MFRRPLANNAGVKYEVETHSFIRITDSQVMTFYENKFVFIRIKDRQVMAFYENKFAFIRITNSQVTTFYENKFVFVRITDRQVTAFYKNEFISILYKEISLVIICQPWQTLRLLPVGLRSFATPLNHESRKSRNQTK